MSSGNNLGLTNRSSRASFKTSGYASNLSSVERAIRKSSMEALVIGVMTLAVVITPAFAMGPNSSGDKPMFELMDRYRLPDGADHLAWNRAGDKLVVGSWPGARRGRGFYDFDAHVAVFDLHGERLKKTHEFILNPAAKGGDVVAFSPDDRYIAVGNTTVELFDLQENRSVWVTEHGVVKANQSLLPHWHFSIAFSEDGRQIYTVGEEQLTDGNNTALFWGSFDIQTGAYSVAHKTTILSLPHAVATTRGNWSVTPEMTVKGIIPRHYWVSVRELGTGKEISRLEPTRPPGVSGPWSALTLSHDGHYLAVGGQREAGSLFPYLQIWDIAENRLLHEHFKNDYQGNDPGPLPTGGAIHSLDISPDGKWLLMRQGNAGRAPDLHMLDMASGQRVWSWFSNVGYGICRFAPTQSVFACAGYKEVLVFKKNN